MVQNVEAVRWICSKELKSSPKESFLNLKLVIGDLRYEIQIELLNIDCNSFG